MNPGYDMVCKICEVRHTVFSFPFDRSCAWCAEFGMVTRLWSKFGTDHWNLLPVRYTTVLDSLYQYYFSNCLLSEVQLLYTTLVLLPS